MTSNYFNKYSLNSGFVNREEGVFPSYFNHQRYTKDTFKNIIELLLKDIPTYKFYPQSADYKTRTFITVANPYEIVDFPAIVIDSAPGSDIVCDFQNFIQDLINELGHICGERYGGLIESNLSIIVYAKSTQERDELVDLVNVGVFQIKRRALESQGIVVKQPSIDNEDEELVGTDKIYSTRITCQIYTHWVYDILYEDIVAVRTELGAESPDNPPSEPIEWIPVDDTIILDGKPYEEPVIAGIPGSPGCGDGTCETCGKDRNTGANVGSRYYQAAVSESSCACE